MHLLGLYLNKKDVPQKFYYDNTGQIHRNLRGFSNTTYNIPCVENHYVFRKVSSNYYGLRLKLIPDQKNVTCMMYLFVNFIKPG